MVAEGGRSGRESHVVIIGQGDRLRERQAGRKGLIHKARGEGWESGGKAFLSRFIQECEWGEGEEGNGWEVKPRSLEVERLVV